MYILVMFTQLKTVFSVIIRRELFANRVGVGGFSAALQLLGGGSS